MSEENLERKVAIAKNCNTAHEAILREEWEEAEKFLKMVLDQVQNEKDAKQTNAKDGDI